MHRSKVLIAIQPGLEHLAANVAPAFGLLPAVQLPNVHAGIAPVLEQGVARNAAEPRSAAAGNPIINIEA